MENFGQIPFSASSFAENPEPRVPVVLLLDTSGSMKGIPIRELNAGLVQFKDELVADGLAAKRVEIATITFGPVSVVHEFVTADAYQPPILSAGNDTPMGAAIKTGLDLLRTRKDVYRANGIAYYRPWAFLITDGAPTDSWHGAAQHIKEGEAQKGLSFFAVGTEDANFDILKQLSVRQPLRLKEMRFRDLFIWLSTSLSSVSQSQVGDGVPLSNPITPDGWAAV